MTNRRHFLQTAAAGAAVPAATAAPVREKPLAVGFWGCHYIDEAESAQVGDVLKSGDLFRYYGQSRETPAKVATFEKEFAARMGVRFVLGVATGTAALDVALAAMEIGPGDEVIVPAFTFISCYNTVVLAGALPVFAEIDESFNLDPADVARKITPRTKAIIAVHMRGSACDMDPIMELARAKGIKVLEDCAQSMGATYKGKAIGSIGDMGMFSLQVSKPMTAGEGGIVTTNSPALYERAVRYHDVGQVRPPAEKVLGKATLEAFPGTNLRMNELTGAVALAQLRKLDKMLGLVRGHGRKINQAIQDLKVARRKLADARGELASGIFLGFQNKEACDRFIAGMRAENVPAMRPPGGSILPLVPHVTKKAAPRPNWPSFQLGRGATIEYNAATCPRSIDIVNRHAGVMLDPAYTARDVDDIIAAIRKVCGQA